CARESDFWLGLEADVIGHAGLVATCFVIRPLLRQIQAIRHGQAGVVIGDRQHHRHLAIVLLAELAAEARHGIEWEYPQLFSVFVVKKMMAPLTYLDGKILA